MGALDAAAAAAVRAAGDAAGGRAASAGACGQPPTGDGERLRAAGRAAQPRPSAPRAPGEAALSPVSWLGEGSLGKLHFVVIGGCHSQAPNRMCKRDWRL